MKVQFVVYFHLLPLPLLAMGVLLLEVMGKMCLATEVILSSR